MLIGALMVEWMMWAGRADVLFTSYVPLRADPLFYLGVILFAVGALVTVSSSSQPGGGQAGADATKARCRWSSTAR